MLILTCLNSVDSLLSNGFIIQRQFVWIVTLSSRHTFRRMLHPVEIPIDNWFQQHRQFDAQAAVNSLGAQQHVAAKEQSDCKPSSGTFTFEKSHSDGHISNFVFWNSHVSRENETFSTASCSIWILFFLDFSFEIVDFYRKGSSHCNKHGIYSSKKPDQHTREQTTLWLHFRHDNSMSAIDQGLH